MKQETELITFGWMQKSLDALPDNDGILWGKDYIILDGSRLFRKFTEQGTPYRMDDLRIIFVEKGEADLTINLTHYHLQPGTLQFLAKGSMVQVDDIHPDFSVSGLIFGEEYLRNLHGSRISTAFEGLPSEIVLCLDENEQKVLQAFLRLIRITASEGLLPDELLTSHIASLLCLIENFQQRHAVTSHTSDIRREEIFHRFISLVNSYHEKEHNVRFYADRLCLSSKYLSFVVRQVSGYTPKDWINRALLTNARFLLRQTSFQITQISWKLNYPSPSSFCKFFHHMTGLTPQEYRRG